MSNERSVLVIGATGTVGKEATLATTAAGGRVRALVRSESRARDLGADVELVRGDLRDDASLERALENVSAALYVSPHEPDEELLADRFVRACEARGVRLVFVGVHVDGASSFARAIKRFAYGRMFPHYLPKFRLSERVRTSAARPIVLMPTNFFQNDEFFRADIEGGSFPQPFERAVNRVDVRDLGLAAARALLDPELASGAYPVVGPESLTGDACAAVWSTALGREVRCERDTSKVEAAIARAASGKKREDLVKTYAVLRRITLATEPEQLARTASLIGRAPTSYEAYVTETLARWSEGARSAA